MALQPGDLMFVGWDTDNNDVAFITTTVLEPGQVIYFTDDEYNSATGQFVGSEQLIRWTVPPEGVQPGTVITVDMEPSPGRATVRVGDDVGGDPLGTVDYLRGGGLLGNNNEMFWALEGTVSGNTLTPTTFLSVIANEADGNFRRTPDTNGTGLEEANAVVRLDNDVDYGVFDRLDLLTDVVDRESLLQIVTDTANWDTGNTNPNPGPELGFDLGGAPRVLPDSDVVTLFFRADQVAYFDGISADGGDTTFTGIINPLPEGAIVEIDIRRSSIQDDGEFDFSEVFYERVEVFFEGESVQFGVVSDAKIKESGASNSSPGGADEQGDTFFLTNDAVILPADNPLGLSAQSGKLVFSSFDSFVTGQETTITRLQDVDNNGDGIAEPGNANFNVGAKLVKPPICFVSGTLIETAEGERPVEEIAEGDLVRTLDHGFQPVRWVGRQTVPAVSAMAPVRIAKGALGNARTIRVSQQHRILLTDWRAELLFGQPEVLVAARHLCNDDTVRVERDAGEVTYIHLMFDRHQIVFTSGMMSESFLPREQALRLAGPELRRELSLIMPEAMAAAEEAQSPSRAVLKRHEGALVARRAQL